MKAVWQYDFDDRIHFVRLVADDGSFESVCSCPGQVEAELIVRCLNAVANTDADRCMKASLALRKFMGFRLRNNLADIPADIHK
jgi:hypothetical protein